MLRVLYFFLSLVFLVKVLITLCFLWYKSHANSFFFLYLNGFLGVVQIPKKIEIPYLENILCIIVMLRPIMLYGSKCWASS